ncbi:MAG: hypothetical protein OXF49_01415 [Candidatus Saccharibacteria bacterium]|nr:hypothetical protein [Candidatus Saccharibacteria bacterium]
MELVASLLSNAEATVSVAVINSHFLDHYLAPLLYALIGIAGLVSVFFVSWSGILYMISAGKVDQLETAKRTLKNALLGLVLVIGAGVLVHLLTTSYGGAEYVDQSYLPNISEVEVNPSSGSLLDLITQTVVGFLQNILSSIFSPFMQALEYLSQSTPFMSDNGVVLKMWLAVLGIANGLLILIVTLLGFQMMTASVLGFEELSFKQLLPKIGAVFLLMNASLFIIDVLINLSNGMIEALKLSFDFESFWVSLNQLFGNSGTLSIALLIISLLFVVLAFILMVYYVMRLITLYVGAILSPLVVLLGLLPAFRDFAFISFKTYLSHIFVLFVHTILFILSGSLLAGIQTSSGGATLMSLVLGIATLVAVLKTQGLLNQLHYASVTPKALKRIGGHFISGVSHISKTIEEVKKQRAKEEEKIKGRQVA